jgi:hypothetical protein
VLAERLRRLLPGLWAGWLVCVAALATPAAFALLERAVAGRVVARMLAQEAATSLALGAALLVLERLAAKRHGGPQFGAGFALAAGALFCTVAGYYGVQPLMAAARAGQGALSFGQLHLVSTALYAVKLVLVLALAWRAAAPAIRAPASS